MLGAHFFFFNDANVASAEAAAGKATELASLNFKKKTELHPSKRKKTENYIQALKYCWVFSVSQIYNGRCTTVKEYIFVFESKFTHIFTFQVGDDITSSNKRVPFGVRTITSNQTQI